MGGAVLKYVESSGIVDHDGLKVGVVRFTERMEVLSSAVLNGGVAEASALFIMQVPHDYDCSDPMTHIRAVRDDLGLPEDSVGMMTAAEVGYVFNVQERAFGGSMAVAIATAGLSNHVVAGDELVDWQSRHQVSLKRAARMMAGTINVAVVSDVPLTDEAKVNLMMPLVEAKSAALADRGFRETGTTSDAMAIVSPKGDDRAEYAGTGSSLGIAAARAVRAAVGRALEVRFERPVPEDPVELLEKLGYGAERMLAMSGSSVDEGRFKESLAEYLGGSRMRSFVDLIHFISYRADSLIADGDEDVGPMVSEACRVLAGLEPDLSEGVMRGIAGAIAAEAGRRAR